MRDLYGRRKNLAAAATISNKSDEIEDVFT
jgi:hypothetical protein